MFERVEKVLVSEKARWSYGTLGSEAILVVLETKKKMFKNSVEALECRAEKKRGHQLAKDREVVRGH